MARDLVHIDISRMPDLARLAGEVRATNTPCVLRQGNADVAVLISPEQWDRFQQLVMDEFFQAVDALRERNREVDPEEVERDVTEEVEKVRRERYERRRQAGHGS